jgi:hypothetical protein
MALKMSPAGPVTPSGFSTCELAETIAAAKPRPSDEVRLRY